MGDDQHGLAAELVGDARQHPEHPVGRLPTGLATGDPAVRSPASRGWPIAERRNRVVGTAEIVAGRELVEPFAHPHRQPETPAAISAVCTARDSSLHITAATFSERSRSPRSRACLRPSMVRLPPVAFISGVSYSASPCRATMIRAGQCTSLTSPT